MSGVELAVAIVGIVELCFSHGSALVELCKNLKTAEARIGEMAVQIQSHWLRTKVQLEFLHRVWKSLDEEHQSIQVQILQILVDKLNHINSNIRKVVAKDPEAGTPQDGQKVKKWAYMRLRESLGKALEDLEVWQKTFDPSWFLIMKIANPIIDAQLGASQEAKQNPAQEALDSAYSLRKAICSKNSNAGSSSTKSVFLPYEGLNSARVFEIPFTSAKLTQRKGSQTWLILDPIRIPPGVSISQLENTIRALARKLFDADPATFGLLNCYGAVRVPDPLNPRQVESFSIVFRVPRGMSDPSTLRGCLIQSTDVDHSLSDRFRIAQELARSVSYIHTHGFVHKNIRPETILLLRNKPLTTAAATLGSAFLVGFENFRAADGCTLYAGDTRWERNLYRHPQRVGLNPADDYLMQHDIYSLGVCLLELGLWQSLVVYSPDYRSDPTPAPILKDLGRNRGGGSSQLFVKDYLVTLAQRDLPKRMGTKFARVVETCLTCLDEDNVDFGDESEFQDQDGILVAVRYIEKILFQLDSISV